MVFRRGLRVLLVVSCVVVALCVGCSSKKIADQGPVGYEGQGVDISNLPKEELVFRYAGTGNLEAMEALLEANPGLVNIVEDADYRTPLHVAARNGNAKMAQLLLDHGADPLIEDRDGKIPADCARQEAHLDLAKSLMEAAKNVE